MSPGNRTGSATALYSLERVRELVPNAWLMPDNTVQEVMRERQCSEPHARKYIREKLRVLTPANYTGRFFFSSGRRNGQQADEYEYDDRDENIFWYIKIRIENEQLVVHSFHVL